MKNLKRMLSAALAVVGLALGAPAVAQQPTASVHGHVQNAAGQPITKGDVGLTKNKSADQKDVKMDYTFPLDAQGNYSGKGIAPGDYFGYVTVDGKKIDRMDLVVKAGDDKTLDFDMTREEYVKNMTPEERKQIEEFKKKNAEATQANKVIANLNATLASVRTDLKTASPNFDKDVADMKSATDAKPEEGVLWMTYGDALAASADHKAGDDKKVGKPVQSDADVMKLYDDAVAAYKKGADLNAASKKPSPGDQAIAWSQAGNALAKEGKVDDARQAYEKAASLQPAQAGMFYNNEAAVLYNASQQNASLGEGALAAADKAIQAEPNRPDPYYIKGQILLQKATLDPKTQKLVTPPGCLDAYQAYLSLDPNGKYAASVKEVLASLGEKIDTHYRAPGGKR